MFWLHQVSISQLLLTRVELHRRYVTKNAVSKTLPHVHEQAINCVLSTVQGPAHSDYSAGWRTRRTSTFAHHRSSHAHSFDPHHAAYYIVSDLEKISYKLFELQDEDELAELAQASTRRKSSGGTRSRRSTVVEEEVQPTEVEKFVKMKQAWVEQTQKVRTLYLVSMPSLTPSPT